MKKYYLVILITFGFTIPVISQTVTNVGTDFWIAFPPNANPNPLLQIFISSNFATSGSISSAYPGVNQSFNVLPGIVTQISLPAGVQLLSGLENKGIHITSNDPISVYGLNHIGATTDAYLALPVDALGLDYWIITYKVTLSNSPSAFSIVATQDGTSLTIFNHQTNATTNVTLDQGQTWLVTAPGLNEDVTGSRVQSNFPVGVFGSVQCVDIPSISCAACDHIVEMMWPYNSWGKNFVTVSLAGRDNTGDVFRMVAAEDGTDISINGTNVSTINTGDYYETVLTGNNAITTNKAILLAQLAKGIACSGNTTGDPFMMLIPPCEQFLTNYTVVNVSGGFTTQWVNVVAPDYALSSIYQDGVLIPTSAFTQISTTNFYGAQRAVSAGSHTFNSTFPFGVFVYGWGAADSYGYPGGGSLSPVGTVHNVTLSPDTSYGQLNVTNVCLTANVTDNFLNPVAGVLVNFNITGIIPLIGNAYTDALGNAQFCYTQTGLTPGEDFVVAEVFGYKSDTAVVFWSYTPPCTDPVSGGTIGSDQNGCGSFIPVTLTNIQAPTGFIGTLEYKWQLSTTSSTTGFTDITGSNSAFYNPAAVTQTTWYKRLARVDCMSNWTSAVESNVVQITINPLNPVTITITSSENPVCAGTFVTFTAADINGGPAPFYQWKVNGINKGSNNPIYSYIPVNGDCITCTLTSNINCPSGNPATSNQICMTVNPNMPVSITITASANPVCTGTLVTFSSATMYGGPTPFYAWEVNGISVGTNNPTYSYIPLNGDLVECILTSDITCPTGNPATSNTITMTVSPYVTVSIAINASANPVCAGIAVTYTAATIYGGPTPGFQWKVNGINVGTNNPSYIYTPLNGDLVSCILTSGLPCTTNNPATSNGIMMNVKTLPVVTFSRCNDSITITTAQPFKLKGGIPLGGIYTGPGVTNGILNPAVAGVGTKTITYSYTNSASCAVAASLQFVIRNPSFGTCGSALTDPRDNKPYPTVKIGNQCWMASNLNYGTMIMANSNQRDNCISEKYCPNDLAANCSLLTADYQWDEIMNYDETISTQGLCPPGWHVPNESDWTTLFSNYINFGYAASPLKYSGFSGFNAILTGVSHLNIKWDFQGFGTFFWSSAGEGPTKAWAHGMNDPNPSVSAYPAFRTNAFSVRCLKDN